MSQLNGARDAKKWKEMEDITNLSAASTSSTSVPEDKIPTFCDYDSDEDATYNP